MSNFWADSNLIISPLPDKTEGTTEARAIELFVGRKNVGSFRQGGWRRTGKIGEQEEVLGLSVGIPGIDRGPVANLTLV